MAGFMDAAGEQLQGLKQQMQQLGRKAAAPAGSNDGGGKLAGLSYGAIVAEVMPLIGPAIDGLLSRFRSAPEPEPVVVVPVRRKRVFTVSRVAGAGAVLVLGALAYGLGSGKLRINVQPRRSGR